MISVSNAERLWAALGISCLLHLALVLMPYPGPRTGASGPVQASRMARAPGSFSVTLLVGNGPSSALAEAVPDGADKAQSPAGHLTGEQAGPALGRADGLDLLKLPQPVYYRADQLTQHPRPSAEPELHTPDAWPMVASGSVILKLWISERGEVISVEIEKTDLPEVLARAAAEAFGRSRFLPGEINGRRVASVMRIEVNYESYDGRRGPGT
jgi:hypothetical protein